MLHYAFYAIYSVSLLPLTRKQIIDVQFSYIYCYILSKVQPLVKHPIMLSLIVKCFDQEAVNFDLRI